MDKTAEDSTRQEKMGDSNRRAAARLFSISMFILFLELACIRWFPAHVLFLTFFTNTVLLASFLGMSVGCLAAGRPSNYLRYTHYFLAVGVFAALGIELLHARTDSVVISTHQSSPQVVFFGTERPYSDPAQFVIPIEAVGAFFFLIIALLFVGPGQELGRSFGRMPNRIAAYTLNICGSMLSIAVFAVCSWFEFSPFWWFLPILLVLGYFTYEGPLTLRVLPRWMLLALILTFASLWTGTYGEGDMTRQFFWSPYYRIDYLPTQQVIAVNQIGHQQMFSTAEKEAVAYSLPYLLNRDAGGQTPRDVLIIGAGSGNDVSRAFQWGAETIDAVEIDPVIQRLGKLHHPDHPYDDNRVTVHLDDGRNFLRLGDRKYDLVVYALVDSLILHSSYSNLRLESYLFTNEAFADVRRRLKPGGLFVMYNYFRQGWIVQRLAQELKDAFADQPLVLTLPYQAAILSDEVAQGRTMLMAGNVEPIRRKFAKHGSYWLRRDRGAAADSANGFEQRPDSDLKNWERLGLAEIIPAATPLRNASDDWPFLYVREAMVPALSLRGIAIMGGLSFLLIWFFMPRAVGADRRWSTFGQMFFLGAGFMLIETNAVVHMALLFGSTWMVNSVVFFAVLLMILLANLFTLQIRVGRLEPYFVALAVSLIVNWFVPLDLFLGMDRRLQVALSCLLLFGPILFAGIIFASLFRRSDQPEQAYGANIAGAIAGGLAENFSMLLGFQYLVFLALVFYALTALAYFGSRGSAHSLRA